ncbi:hypothetical protein DMENIID0001_094040 [Sergentomyia squamirostris]
MVPPCTIPVSRRGACKSLMEERSHDHTSGTATYACIGNLKKKKSRFDARFIYGSLVQLSDLMWTSKIMCAIKQDLHTNILTHVVFLLSRASINIPLVIATINSRNSSNGLRRVIVFVMENRINHRAVLHQSICSPLPPFISFGCCSISLWVMLRSGRLGARDFDEILHTGEYLTGSFCGSSMVSPGGVRGRMCGVGEGGKVEKLMMQNELN